VDIDDREVSYYKTSAINFIKSSSEISFNLVEGWVTSSQRVTGRVSNYCKKAEKKVVQKVILNRPGSCS
jgi:hypothetical protein